MAKPVINYNVQFSDLKDAMTFMNEVGIVERTNELKEYTQELTKMNGALDANRMSVRFSRLLGSIASVFVTGTIILLAVLACTWILKTTLSLLGVH